MSEQEAHKRSQAAMTQLRESLKSEMDKIQGQASAEEGAKVCVYVCMYVFIVLVIIISGQ